MIKKIAGITFKNPQLLTTALTHRSALNENKNIIVSNERLEFLGDAVLEIIVSDYLYRQFPKRDEGKLTSLRSKIVQTKTLASTANYLGLGKLLFLSKGEKKAGGQTNISLLADCFEAVIGAIYIDQGISTASRFIHQQLLGRINHIINDKKIIDYKSLLQEKWQQRFKVTPIYKLITVSGPEHSKKFTVKVYLKKKPLGEGSGKSKQDAQQQAAKAALEKKPAIC